MRETGLFRWEGRIVEGSSGAKTKRLIRGGKKQRTPLLICKPLGKNGLLSSRHGDGWVFRNGGGGEGKAVDNHMHPLLSNWGKVHLSENNMVPDNFIIQ